MPDIHDPLRKGALAAYRSGRVKIFHVRANDHYEPVHVIARVVSSRQGGPAYVAEYDGGAWHCTCHAGAKNEPCAHVLAVQLCTTAVPA